MDSALCFTCGQPSGDGRVLNRLDDGRICPACAERLMESLPSLLPGTPDEHRVESTEEAGSEEHAPVLELVEDPPAPEREGA